LLERVSTDLAATLDQIRAAQVLEGAARADQTALYRQAAQEWKAAGDAATALHDRLDDLTAQTQTLAVRSRWRAGDSGGAPSSLPGSSRSPGSDWWQVCVGWSG
jgi:hypothetical protein